MYQFLSELSSLEKDARRFNHRYLVVLSGEESLTQKALLTTLAKLNTRNSLIVTDNPIWNEALAQTDKTVTVSHLKAHLGSDVEQLIWDGFSGLHPDGLGIASGLIKGGGLMFLLLPDFETLCHTPDPDYLRMCSSPEMLSTFSTHFLQRMVNTIESDPDVLVFKHDALTQITQLSTKSEAVSTPPKENHFSPTQDQLETIAAIVNVARGHRKRPLVIQADRGRGKSSALGLAAAKICGEYQLDVIITAPSPRACDAAFEHFQAETLRLFPDQKSQAAFSFYAPDQLLASKPKCHLLLVDEAAAIPAPLLSELLNNHSRIVFSTTVHGYEGTGQGFAVRFRKILDHQTPGWKSIELKQPVRWSEHDPLERWIFDLLLLDAEILEPPELTAAEFSALPTRWVAQSELMADESLFRQVTSLLVLAHYQTSPSDIRLILDHPAIHLSIVEHESNVLAVVLLICEGGIDDPDIAQAIIEGRRRPRGHLVPQTLTASTGIAGLLAQKTFRVMRIAVHPSTTRRGLGSKLIQASVQLALHHKIDYLSASFGFTPELMAFWAKNQCQLVRIGYHKDSASGMQSSIVTRSFTEPMTKHLHQCRAIFRQHFVMGMSSLYRYLDWQIVHGALMALELEPKKPDSLDHSKIKAFAQHFRSFEDSTPALIRFVLNSYSNHSIKQLSSQQQQLLIIKLLQGRSWKTTLEVLKLKGKKVADQQLRNTIDTLPG